MIKKTIEYRNLDGEMLKEDFYFDISEDQLIELELTWEGGFIAWLQSIVDSAASDEPDGGLIMKGMRTLIGLSVGRRHEDGVQFIKDDDIKARFMNSNAYTRLFMELVTDEEKGSEFTVGIMPQEMVEKLAAAKGKDAPTWVKEDRDPTADELKNASREELLLAMKRKSPRGQIPPETPAVE